ncbi:replication-associated protein [Pacific flying fox associated cyclovirus-2]|uniref:Replication-associated protein n=1 Tax=Pacific flying fox associated cyclovirus-2 TaxID=1795984 RepID=A0A140CTJ5_9CIRC|nr:replication-associated protein [Pacific flying fox associated cyclovirus-2]AMH87652.1 replication-associated protein [Pacific flying fox associated cyclovirus-2]
MPGDKPNKSHRRYVFTLNNYGPEDESRLANLDGRYLVYGREVAPTTGTKHLQGYINFGRAIRFNTAREMVGGSGVTEVSVWGAFGPPNGVCFDYLPHGNDPATRGIVSLGKPTSQGRRTDLQRVADLAKQAGTTAHTIAEQFPVEFIKYGRGITNLLRVINPVKSRTKPTNVIVLVGTPGVGKSRFANEVGSALGDTYYKPRGEWWDGYYQQRSVIIDDYYGWLKYDELLKICDRYPHKVPVKGGYEEFTSEYIFITTNSLIDLWYKFDKYTPKAILRRLAVYVTLMEDADPMHYDPFSPQQEWFNVQWQQCIVNWTLQDMINKI